MPKIVIFFKRLIGRLKEMEEQIFLALGSAFIATGLITEIEYPNLPFVWITFMIVAVLCFFGAIREARDSEKKERRLRKQDDERFFELLGNIHKELQKLNEAKK